jgi:hypothetical protein
MPKVSKLPATFHSWKAPNIITKDFCLDDVVRMERKSEKSLRFAGLTLDMARLSLEGQDKQVYLRPKSFDVLRG